MAAMAVATGVADVAPDVPEQTDDFPWWGILLIVVLGLALLSIVVWAMIKKGVVGGYCSRDGKSASRSSSAGTSKS